MHSGLNLGNPVLIAAFRSALLHQGLIALLVFGVLALAWVSVREWRVGEASRADLGQRGKGSLASVLPGLGTGGRASSRAGSQGDEPSWRMLLRVGFGRAATHAVIWARTQTMKVPVPYGSSG